MPRVSQIQAGRYLPPTTFDSGELIPQYRERVAFEVAYNLARVERLEVEGCMQAESSSSPYLDPAPSSVGAGEIRVSERLRVRANREEIGDYLLDDATLDRRRAGAYLLYNLPAWVVEVVYLPEIGSRWTGCRRVSDPSLRSRILDYFPAVEVEEVEVEEVERRRVVEVEQSKSDAHEQAILAILDNPERPESARHNYNEQ